MKQKGRGRDQFDRLKPIPLFLAKVYRLFPLRVRKKKFEKKRYTRGLYGIGIRYALLKSIARECGDNVSIHQGCFILYPEKLSLGSHVSIHPMCYIEAVGGLCIGDNVSLAHAVTVLSATHHYKDRNIPIKDQGISELPAKICDNVWVGAKATILGGRNIGSGSVIAAGAVVTHDVEPNTVVAGVPASFLMER